MNLLFSWLMVFCVLAGLNARVIGADHSHLPVSHVASDACCEHEGQPVSSHEHKHHDGDGHHHHHCCCAQAQPMTSEGDHFQRLANPESRRLSCRHEGEMPPDGPFLSSEKPPLI